MRSDDDIGEFFRYGSVLVPTMDAWPSSAINFATFSPKQGEITVVFKSGETARHPCSIGDWLSYKATPSRGAAYNALFRGRQ